MTSALAAWGIFYATGVVVFLVMTVVRNNPTDENLEMAMRNHPGAPVDVGALRILLWMIFIASALVWPLSLLIYACVRLLVERGDE